MQNEKSAKYYENVLHLFSVNVNFFLLILAGSCSDNFYRNTNPFELCFIIFRNYYEEKLKRTRYKTD